MSQNITQIPAPRVPFIDERTGLISREWFRFLNNQYVLTGGGTVEDEVAVLRSQIDDLQKLPPVIPAVSTSSGPTPVTTTPPVTYTADFTVGATDTWIIVNKSGSTCTATLPSASASSGRVLYFISYQAQLLVSASANVVPQDGGSATTAILAANAGDWATIVSDGTNWVITQAAKFNNLLLE
jgi:hypothetical protein